ncbi:hypothetical protein [Methylobacterium sp. JK268]
MDNDRIVAPPIDMQAVAAAAELYLNAPTTRLHEIGEFTLDLAAAVAADDHACRVLADPHATREDELRAVATALLITLTGKRTLYQ